MSSPSLSTPSFPPMDPQLGYSVSPQTKKAKVKKNEKLSFVWIKSIPLLKGKGDGWVHFPTSNNEKRCIL